MEREENEIMFEREKINDINLYKLILKNLYKLNMSIYTFF